MKETRGTVKLKGKEEQGKKRKEYLLCSPPRTRKRPLVPVQFGKTVGNNTYLANIEHSERRNE